MFDRKIRINLIMNAFQQIFTYILPFITVPYLARVIGADGNGIYSYTTSIVQYFILFGTIGLTLYGTRQIAYVRDDLEESSREFWRITYLRFIFSAIAIVAYAIFVFSVESEYTKYFWIQAIALLSATIDISWYFQGMEEFTLIVKRSVLFKVISIVCIFLFVREADDVGIYILIQVLTVFLANVTLWVSLRKDIIFCHVTLKSVFSHFKPALMLFIPQIAIELYVLFDRTMIGLLADVTQVGLYTKAEEFAKAPLMLLSIFSTVFFPRMSNKFRQNEIADLNAMLNMNLQIVSFIGVGASFGVAAIAADFVPWMLGSEFTPSIIIMELLAPLAWIIGTSNTLGRQYLVPSDKTKVYTFSVICGAVSNFTLNMLFIPSMQAMGACIATITAEFIVTMIQMIYLRDVIVKKEYFFETFKCAVAGLVMFGAVKLTGKLIPVNVLVTFIQILVGGVVYLIVSIVLKNRVIRDCLHSVAGKKKRS